MTAHQRRFWIQFSVIVVLWALFGLFNGWLTHYRWSFSPKPISWGKALYAEMAYAFSGALWTPLVLWLARRYRLEKPRFVPHLLVHVAGSFVYATVVKLLWDALHAQPVNYYGSAFTFGKLFLSINYALDMGVPLYWLIVLLDYAIEYYRRYQASRVEASALQAELAKAQLHALRMQLHPHFLFNTLHTISSLVQEDPETAERMIARLSELLRLSLESSGSQEIPLSQELRFLEAYLEIERTRFEERLAIDFRIDPETADALVPNLILQPLVENAIRHGVANRLEDGRITIAATRRGERLVLRVTDNGSGMPAEGMPRWRDGVGLSTTRARLERMYGRAQFVEFHAAAGGGVDAVLSIPFATGAARVA